jgi:hypothetical protein
MDKLGLDNRDEEIWSILFRIAAFLGGDWPARIEAAARAMVLGEYEQDECPVQSPAEELLTWVRASFRDNEDFLPTRILLQRIMSEADSSSWFMREWRNPMAAAKGLARTLNDVYAITPERATYEGKQERGYHREDVGVDDLDNDDFDTSIDVDSWDWSLIDN